MPSKTYLRKCYRTGAGIYRARPVVI